MPLNNVDAAARGRTSLGHDRQRLSGHGIEVTLGNKCIDATYPRGWFCFGAHAMKFENALD
jgi:hypothetical protein